MASTSAAEPPSATKEPRNWVEMPEELMVDIFQRLPTLEVLDNVRKVCTTWGRICKYPEMWKVINMLKRPNDFWDSYMYCDLQALTKEAVDLSCGELINISIEQFGTDELLDHILLHSNKLKRLCIVDCFRITAKAMSLAITKIPQLEELHLLQTYIDAQDLEVIGRNCPHLKSFKMSKSTCDYHALAIANNMHELRHLVLFDSDMTNDGLEAILNGCPHLDSLDVRNCDKLHLCGDLGQLCMKRIKDFKHGGFCDLNDDSSYQDYINDYLDKMNDDSSYQDYIKTISMITFM